jgi:hypothetical protein
MKKTESRKSHDNVPLRGRDFLLTGQKSSDHKKCSNKKLKKNKKRVILNLD